MTDNIERVSLTEMPDKLEFKPGFIERYSKLTDFENFSRANQTFLRRAIRVNTLKITVQELKKRLEGDWILEPIPWCREGFYIEHRGEEKRRDIGNLKEHALGYIYLQEAASMIPPLVMDIEEDMKVLDMCAAPGSKTTQIGAMLNNTGFLIANDLQGMRLKPLSLNVQRMGLTNSVITQGKAQNLRYLNQKFDRVLLDAPCSGTGTICKSLKTVKTWNPAGITKLAKTQQKLIETAFGLLNPGGILVYSTCSVEPEENEGVIDHLLRNFPDAEIMPIKLNIKSSEPITEFEDTVYDNEIKKSLRLWPQDNMTEGFFVCKIRKRPS